MIAIRDLNLDPGRHCNGLFAYTRHGKSSSAGSIPAQSNYQI